MQPSTSKKDAVNLLSEQARQKHVHAMQKQIARGGRAE